MTNVLLVRSSLVVLALLTATPLPVFAQADEVARMREPRPEHLHATRRTAAVLLSPRPVERSEGALGEVLRRIEDLRVALEEVVAVDQLAANGQEASAPVTPRVGDLDGRLRALSEAIEAAEASTISDPAERAIRPRALATARRVRDDVAAAIASPGSRGLDTPMRELRVRPQGGGKQVELQRHRSAPSPTFRVAR